LGHCAVTQLAPKRESAVSWILFHHRKKAHRLATQEARWLVNLARTQVRSAPYPMEKPTTDPDRLGAMRAVEGKVARLRATQRLRRKYYSALALRPACELLLTAFKVYEMGLIVK
jgi:hypothetical protein